jgi:hypothetical protein
VPFASGGGVDKAKSPPCEVTGEQRKGAVGLEESRSLDNQRERAEAEGGRREGRTMGHLYWARPEGELTGSFRDDDDLGERSGDEQHILKRPRLSLRRRPLWRGWASWLRTVPYRTGPGETTVRNRSVRSSSLGTTPTPVAAYR